MAIERVHKSTDNSMHDEELAAWWVAFRWRKETTARERTERVESFENFERVDVCDKTRVGIIAT